MAQTKDINENIYVDLDADGNLVNMNTKELWIFAVIKNTINL
jgi:uncharacterized protein YuzE